MIKVIRDIRIFLKFSMTVIIKCIEFRLNDSTLELVERYNDVISTIAETFVRYDEMIKALEEAKETNLDR